LEDRISLLLVEGAAYFIEMELMKFGENKSPRYQVHVADVRGGAGVGVAEEDVKGFPLSVSTCIRSKADRFVYCVKDFFEAGASA
jgi:hypothetical protein